MNITRIRKKEFYDAISIHLNKEKCDVTTSDIDEITKIFGIKFLWSFGTEIECQVTKEQELFLYRIKYGF